MKKGLIQTQRIGWIVIATNKDPHVEIAQGRLRQDLYYRVAGDVLNIPPLRKRVGDIPALVTHFLSLQGANIVFQPDVFDLMGTYAWPGNVRELRNVVERVFARGFKQIDAAALMKIAPELRRNSLPPWCVEPAHELVPLRQATEKFRAAYVTHVLQACDKNISQTAKVLKVTENYLGTLLRSYNINTK